MNTKQISKLVAFVVTFALSVTIAGFFKPAQTAQAQRITALLVEDISNGTERRIGTYTFDEFVSKTEEYVSASENIDYSDLPADFTDAWLAHMRAWRNHSDSINNFQAANNLNIHFLEGGSMKMRGNSHIDSAKRQAIRDFNLLEERQSREINRTWYKVLRLAKKYDAEIPSNALD